ncbi:hypothetical protein ACFYY1_42640 [Streptomyces sp. NPDC001890]|uniref:hypothetical protein n=1 Tax=Streptomyces sp. NPDC001890 TaxID=3364620 RepID=UPI00367681E7
MTTHEAPQEGEKLCAWCGTAIQQPGIGRSRDYCRRSCRQRAYEARKQREVVVAAVAAAIARRDSSRVDSGGADGSSRDESGGDFLLAPPRQPGP